MGGFFGGIFWFLMGKFFGIYRKNKTEEELYEAKKENIELKAEMAGQEIEREIDKEETERQKEWENADKKAKYDILRRDFGVDDPD